MLGAALIDWAARCLKLQAENDQLREEVQSLKAVIADSLDSRTANPPSFLSRSEAVIFSLLVERRLVTKSCVMAALYSASGRGNAGHKVIEVFLCKMRKKLAPHGISISTVCGRGWEMPESSKALARELMDAA